MFQLEEQESQNLLYPSQWIEKTKEEIEAAEE